MSNAWVFHSKKQSECSFSKGRPIHEVIAENREIKAAKREAEIAQPKRWNAIYAKKERPVAAVVAGPIRWSFSLALDDRYADLCKQFDCTTCKGVRKTALIADFDTLCRMRSHKRRGHDRIVERRHQVTGHSFKQLELAEL